MNEILEVGDACVEERDITPTVGFEVAFKGDTIRRYERQVYSDEIQYHKHKYSYLYVNGQTTSETAMPMSKYLCVVNMQVEVEKLIEAWRKTLEEK